MGSDSLSLISVVGCLVLDSLFRIHSFGLLLWDSSFWMTLHLPICDVGTEDLGLGYGFGIRFWDMGLGLVWGI